MHLLGCLFLIILVPLIIILVFVVRIISLFLGKTPNNIFINMGKQRQTEGQQREQYSQQTQQQTHNTQEKIFDNSEGEYVDFEEMK